MSTPALLNPQQPAPTALSITETRMTAAQLIEQRCVIVDVMEKAMRKDVDYGIVPGTPKPSLYKPGSEKILSIFHLGSKPRVEDLSTPDTLRYRVHCEIFHQPTGAYLGEGVGEASSAESKYQWRAAVCQQEWDETPADRRRRKWKNGKQGPYSIDQVRADMDDVGNTVLKMAKKRAQIDAVLTVTAASDIFAQDLQDLKDAGLDPAELSDAPGADAPPAEPQPQPELQRKPPAEAAAPAHTPQASLGAKTINEAQAGRFWAIAIKRTADYKKIMEYLKEIHGISNKNLILMARYEEAIKWAETGVIED